MLARGSHREKGGVADVRLRPELMITLEERGRAYPESWTTEKKETKLAGRVGASEK
jgi:hypothetical protein